MTSLKNIKITIKDKQRAYYFVSVALLALLLSHSAYLLIQNKGLKWKINLLESAQLRIRKEGYSKQLKDISEWETFKNDNLNVTFKYPKEIFSVEVDENFNDEPSPSRTVILKGIYDNVEMNILKLPDGKKPNLLDLNIGESSLYEYDFGAIEVTTRLSNKTVAGIESYVFNTPQRYEQVAPVKEVVIPIGNEYYIISYTNVDFDSRNAGISYIFIFNQILSTLQFDSGQ